MKNLFSSILRFVINTEGVLGVILRFIVTILIGLLNYILYYVGNSSNMFLMLLCPICFTESVLWLFYGKNLGQTQTSKKLIYIFPISCFLVFGIYITIPALDQMVSNYCGCHVNLLYIASIIPPIFIFLTMYILSWDKHIEWYKPKLRILHMLILTLFIIYFILFFIVVPEQFRDSCYFIAKGDDRLGFFLVILDIALLIWFYYLKKSQYYFVYPQKKYILYLRSFATSLTNEVINACKNTFKCEILEVADPSTGLFGSQSNVDSLFLPDEDWKPQVRYYIKRASFVLCEVGTSEGVKWEMFNNEEFIEKYIFWIKPDIKYVDSESDSIVKECLTFLAEKSNDKELFFCIKKNICMYSTSIEHISQVVMFGKTEEDVQEIKLARSVIPQYKGNDVETKDILRLLQRFFYLVLSKIRDIILLVFKFMTAYIFRPINVILIQPLNKYILQPIKKYA